MVKNRLVSNKILSISSIFWIRSSWCGVQETDIICTKKLKAPQVMWDLFCARPWFMQDCDSARDLNCIYRTRNSVFSLTLWYEIRACWNLKMFGPISNQGNIIRKFKVLIAQNYCATCSPINRARCYIWEKYLDGLSFYLFYK